MVKRLNKLFVIPQPRRTRRPHHTCRPGLSTRCHYLAGLSLQTIDQDAWRMCHKIVISACSINCVGMAGVSLTSSSIFTLTLVVDP